MIKPVLQDDAFIADVMATRGGSHDSFRLRWIGQSGYLLQWRRSHVLIDPYLSDSLTAKYAATSKPHVRISERVVAPERLNFIDLITSSHAHTDHLDPHTLTPVARASRDVALLAPAATSEEARNRSGIEPRPMIDGSEVRSRDFHIIAVVAAHPEREVDDKGRDKFLGYLFKFGQWTIYHSGDTVVYDGMGDRLRRGGPIDIAILPINGKVGNMGGGDAARLAKEIGARLVIPCHYDMFEFNTADPYAEFVPDCERIGQRYRVLQLGERFSSAELPPR